MSQNGLQRAAILLSLISIVVVIFGIKIVTGKMDTIASMQFGGKDNYQVAQKLFTNPKFIEQQNKQLTTALSQMDGAAANPAANPSAPAANPQAAAPKEEFVWGTLTPEQLTAIKKNAVIEGDAKAKYTIVEYSDPECPYCIRHHNDGTIAGVIGAFTAGEVNHIFKPVQWVNHAGTEYKSLAILCAGKIKGNEGFVGMYTSLFKASTPQAATPTSKVMEIAQQLKINTSDLEACITKGDTKAQYAASWAEFQTFTQSPGTPGNIVINNATGKWKLIAGAYPAAAFKPVIESLK
jgi:protein-disulfide isomerase